MKSLRSWLILLVALLVIVPPEPETFASVSYHHDEAAYAIRKLAGFFESVEMGTNPEFEAKVARIIAWYLAEQIKKLQELAQELDEYYAS